MNVTFHILLKNLLHKIKFTFLVHNFWERIRINIVQIGKFWPSLAQCTAEGTILKFIKQFFVVIVHCEFTQTFLGIAVLSKDVCLNVPVNESTRKISRNEKYRKFYGCFRKYFWCLLNNRKCTAHEFVLLKSLKNVITLTIFSSLMQNYLPDQPSIFCLTVSKLRRKFREMVFRRNARFVRIIIITK